MVHSCGGFKYPGCIVSLACDMQIGLAFVDFVVDCIFVAELHRAEDAHDGGRLQSIALLSEVFLAIPMTANLVFTVNLLLKEFRSQAVSD